VTEPSEPVGQQPTVVSAPAWQAPSGSDGAGASPSDRPEVPVAAAFAGGFVFALILRRLAR
jgi:hypothetical protein